MARVVVGGLETAVATAKDQQRPDLEALAAVIARSPIVVARLRSAARRRLPVGLQELGFDELDLAILGWIAAEGRHAGRRFVRM